LGYIRAQFEKGTTKRATSEVCPFGKTKNSACALFVKVHPHLAFYSGRARQQHKLPVDPWWKKRRDRMVERCFQCNIYIYKAVPFKLNGYIAGLNDLAGIRQSYLIKWAV